MNLGGVNLKRSGRQGVSPTALPAANRPGLARYFPRALFLTLFIGSVVANKRHTATSAIFGFQVFEVSVQMRERDEWCPEQRLVFRAAQSAFRAVYPPAKVRAASTQVQIQKWGSGPFLMSVAIPFAGKYGLFRF
jgi:hypothetical protein